MSTASRRDGKGALLHTESPLSVTVTLTEADLRAAGVNGSGQRLSLPQVLSWVSLPGGGVAAAEQADTRPLPPIRTVPLGRLPHVASWRDVLELGSASSSRLRELGETYLPSSSHRLRELVGSSSSSRLRELGETCLLFGRASAGHSFSRAVSGRARVRVGC